MHIFPFVERIICVEPTPAHFVNLKEMAGGFAELENSALSDHTGQETFYPCGINTTMNSLQDRFNGSIEVNSITLGDLLDKYELKSVDLCKIDIEGSEWKAITEETLSKVKGRIKRFFIELHPPNGESQEVFKHIFEKSGYKVTKHFHDTLLCEL